MREDRRRRYDDGFRREALEPVKAGAGKDTLARRLAIPVYTARNRIRPYRSGGEEAVMGGGGSRRYDWETKVSAARDHVENGMTKTEVMARHGIASIAPLERWCREYRAGGPEALRPKPKGRPKGTRSRPKPKPTREQELAEEVAYLKAKVAYLEKLRALRASKSRGASEAPSSDCSQGRGTGSTTSSR
ncbi:transposase [Bifidobacterium ruminantium]|uniref:Transposase n=2 Tax=Bifidobacterium ruminantium TaxID=78346 RepID=A0A087CWL7_BIFRU|nr:transposase [Bifidobacterium ruminantium]